MPERKRNKPYIHRSLQRMHMPTNLIRWIEAGTLAQHVRQAYASLDAMNELLDAWEERCPAAAELTPFAAGRAAWKAAGRPRPNWLEILVWYEQQQYFKPIGVQEVTQGLLTLHSPQIQESKRRRKAREAAGAA